MKYSYPVEEVFLSVLRQENRTAIVKQVETWQLREWQRLFEFSVLSGLFPQFFYALCNTCPECIPLEFLGRARNIFAFNLKRNSVLERELFVLLGRLKDRGIDAIPLKGPVWARYLYGDSALRQAPVDLDLMVRAERRIEAEQVLDELGYQYPYDAAKVKFFHTYRHQIELVRRCGDPPGLKVDLHWGFCNRFVDAFKQEFWERARDLSVDGHTVLCFCLEHLVLYCVSVALYDFDRVRVKYIYDFHALINKAGGNLDLTILAKKASDLRLDKALYFVALLSRDFFKTDLPAGLFQSVRPPFMQKRILSVCLNAQDILRNRKMVAGYVWSYLSSSYLYSRSIFDCLTIIQRKIFLPMREVAGCYGSSFKALPFFLYCRRLSKPFCRR